MQLKIKTTKRILIVILLCTILSFIQIGSKVVFYLNLLPNSSSIKTDTVSGSEDSLPNFFLPSDNPPEVRFDWALTLTYPSIFVLGSNYSVQIHLSIINFNVENGQLKSAIIQYEPVVDGYPFEQSLPKEINYNLSNSWEFTYTITKIILENKEDIAYLSNGQTHFYCKGVIIGIMAENGDYGQANYLTNPRCDNDFYITLSNWNGNDGVTGFNSSISNGDTIPEYILPCLLIIGFISLIVIIFEILLKSNENFIELYEILMKN